MKFLSRLWEMLGWKSLYRISTSRVLKFSGLAVGLTPILARLSVESTANPAGFLAQMFDPINLQVPINLLRVFWASLLVLVAGAVVRLACPKMIRRPGGFPAWRDSADGKDVRQRIVDELGGTDVNAIEKSMLEEYHKRLLRLDHRQAPSRLFVMTLLLASSYLILRVLCDQIAPVVLVTQPLKLFWN